MMRAGWHDPFPRIDGIRWQARTTKQPWALLPGAVVVYERSGKVNGSFRFFVYRRRFGYPDEQVGRSLDAHAAVDLARSIG